MSYAYRWDKIKPLNDCRLSWKPASIFIVMGRHKKKDSHSLESEVLPLLEVCYTEPLFELVCHPSRPLIYSGLASGYLYCHKYDREVLKGVRSEREQEAGGEKVKPWVKVDSNVDNDGIRVIWKTKRHQGSVRCLGIDAEGEYLYSVGADNVLKKADAETGKVIKKISLKEHGAKFTKLIKSTTHPYLLLGDEVGNVFMLDSETLKLKNQVKEIHGGDAINDIFQFSKRSLHKYVSLGQTTLAYWDARESNEGQTDDTPEDKRKVLVSDDQEDEVLCGAFVDPEEGDTLVCGMGEGILTVWKPKKNDLEDQVNRIKVAKDESIDAVVPTLQDDQCVWCGVSNGNLYKVDTKRGKVVEIREHSEVDEVGFLDLDYDYGLVSGGMESVLIWDNDTSTGGDEKHSGHEDEANNPEGTDVHWTSAISSDGYSSNENSDISGEGASRLSREELVKELDRDLEEGENKNNVVEEHQGIKRKPKEKRLRSAKRMRGDHGIAKFDGL
ncbi:related to WD repeat-containing protein JIP5 [Zygosaccharomyces bailii ISA1307]|nr:related to WD repeat-containing protein JIP5 [Zygosaccharomyces bailii ISA1307]